MAILIEITKISEKKDIGFYHVFTEQFGGADFYVGFDKKFHKIYCFLTNNFSNPIRIIDLNNPNERIGELPGVSASALSKIFMTAIKVFELNEFPQHLDYCA
jgi:hypothetical protein